MKLEYYSEKKLKKEVLEIVGKHLDLKKYKVFFFGSRVRGDNFPRSDIDIGIEGPRKIHFRAKMKIDEEIEENIPTLYKIDVIDFKNASENFVKEASRHKEYINKK